MYTGLETVIIAKRLRGYEKKHFFLLKQNKKRMIVIVSNCGIDGCNCVLGCSPQDVYSSTTNKSTPMIPKLSKY